MSASLLALAGAALGAPGDRDPSWGRRGIVHLPSDTVIVDAVSAPAGGTVVLIAPDLQGSPLQVWKLTAAGAVDADFGTNGSAALPADLAATSLDFDGDGRIVVAGYSRGDPGPTKAGAARLAPDGAVDASFGAGGLATIDLSGKATSAAAVLTEPGGGVALAISASDPGSSPGSSMGVARFDAGGVPDPSFGGHGVSDLVPGSPSELARDGSGRYLLGNWFGSFDGPPRVARITPWGTVDTGFGTAGVAALPQPFGVYAGSVSGLAAESASGPVVLYAAADQASTKGGGYVRLLRLDPSGAVGESFDIASIGSSRRGPHRYFSATDVAIDGSGRMVVAGEWLTTGYPGTTSDPAVVRLLPDGSPDRAFGERGLAVIPTLELNSPAGSFTGITLQPDGSIVGLGAGVAGPLQQPILIRLLAGPGRADADADRIADARDECPLTAGRKRHHGCPLLKRTLAIFERPNGTLAGTVAGPRGCRREMSRGKHRRDVSVRVMRSRAGVDEVAARRRLRHGTWRVNRKLGRGRYYAEVSRIRNGSVGICPAARSRVITLRPD